MNPSESTETLHQQAHTSLLVSDAPHSIQKEKPTINLFQKYLTIWVLLCMAIGIILGYFVPALAEGLDKATVSEVSIPIAVLLWGMIFPMMLQVDFSSVLYALKHPKGIVLVSLVNYAIQPFTMFGLALLFFKVIFGGYLGTEKTSSYIVGAVILGSAPCTAMVFIWAALMKGNASYTVSQVAINDLILLAAYVPTVKLLAGTTAIEMPWSTLLFSVGFFVAIPLALGVITRHSLVRSRKGREILNQKLIPFLDRTSMVFLLLMIILIFISQARTITKNFIDILIIAVPLLIQTIFIWGLTYVAAWLLKLPYDIAGPSSLIACSNFFELAVAIAISIYGPASPETLVTVVGVLIEVPVMLVLVWINNKTQNIFKN